MNQKRQQEAPQFFAEDIFPVQALHTHASSIVELPNGDLLACWFEGTGERTADDAAIMGARKKPGDAGWSQPFLMANSEGFPDTNPVLFLDDRGVLWLFWSMIIANLWETSLVRCRTSRDFEGDGCPNWEWQDHVILKQKPDFPEIVAGKVQAYREIHPREYPEWRDSTLRKAADKYFRRMGWQTRDQPRILGEGHYALPLYSDGFRFSIMAITRDGGKTWHASEPIVGMGCIQPSVARRKDGTLVAYMRNNGPTKRVAVSKSNDGGETWGPVGYTEFPNPSSSCILHALQSGTWLLVNNHSEAGRHNLLVSLSFDEGATWSVHRYLENDEREKTIKVRYPTVIQTQDGLIHVTYSLGYLDREGRAETIRHAVFNEAWVMEAGDGGLGTIKGEVTLQ